MSDRTADAIERFLTETTMDDVWDDIRAERERQDERWGQQNHDPPVWLMILGEEVGEANKAALEALFDETDRPRAVPSPDRLADYRIELVQVAAVAVAMVESLDRMTYLREGRSR